MPRAALVDENTSWGLDLIHPDDLATVRALVPNGKVFR
ncbi:hypothetical protein DB30_04941 [Enhygromyxa salina]|uniref:Uncharacterized protein n=1 Tax=Enhygromyxa salina TaxID=215803 RepID=A0A0C1ZEG8_9BACT|nr:hypothetical protein DB30_04941 [Enhygromyxa salina]